MFNSTIIRQSMGQKHSKIGLVACIISVSTMLIMLSILSTLFLNGDEIKNGLRNCIVMVSWISFFSMSLGIASLCETDRKKSCGIWSLIWPTILIIFMFFVVLVG